MMQADNDTNVIAGCLFSHIWAPAEPCWAAPDRELPAGTVARLQAGPPWLAELCRQSP